MPTERSGKIDHALILAAGAGTRMGRLGKILPKPLWPVFEKNLLELELAQARALGAKKIYVNIHNYRQKMLEAIRANQAFKDVVVLIEKDKLDVGGAVHNMAERAGYRGNLLVLNSDQFIFLGEKIWARAWKRYRDCDILLFGHDVNSSDLYNGLVLKDDRLERVAPNAEFERNQRITTYTGMSLINLDRLAPVKGESRFFESVANPEKLACAVHNIKSSPYWDFGTLQRYWDGCFEVLKRLDEGRTDLFIEFLLKTGALNPAKAGPSSYNAKGENAINLSGSDVGDISNKIILGPFSTDSKALSGAKKTVVAGEETDRL